MNKDGIHAYSGFQLVLDCESGYTNTLGRGFSVALWLIHFNDLVHCGLLLLNGAGGEENCSYD